MFYGLNKNEIDLCKSIITKNNKKLEELELDYLINKNNIINNFFEIVYVENIWLSEFPKDYCIQKIMIDNYKHESIEFKDEIFFLLDNFKVFHGKPTQHWGFTFYIFTDYNIYSTRFKNRLGHYFTRIEY